MAQLIGGALVKSVQYVQKTATNGVSSETITINPVNTANTIVIPTFNNSQLNGTDNVYFRLTNSTTVTMYHLSSITGTTVVFTAVVIEFHDGVKSIQYANSTVARITGTSTGTVTIAAVNTAKTAVWLLGGATQASNHYTEAYVALTNATTLTFTSIASYSIGNSVNCAIVVEFM